MPSALLRRLRSSIRTDRVPFSRREQWYALAVALLAGVAVWILATQLFPYHSSNDDEAVYLLQAAMLLEGQLELHAGELAGAFRPWFFIEDGGRLYPKYSPVPSAMYAVSMALFGEPRVTLAAVAAGNAALVYVLGSIAVDRRVGVVAAAVFAASPMTLLTTSVFLPYAPTTVLNLAFAVCYLRGVRSGRLRDAGAAGTAIGLAFFARPYTAVLFAAPFICHALWTVVRPLRRGDWDPRERFRPLPNAIRRNAVTAAIGLAFVGVALAYNARLTGSALVFPYQAFAPLDGPGFGRRRLLDHSIEYTPALALEANAYVLEYFWTRWFAAGPLGSLAALAGLGAAVRGWIRRDTETESPPRAAGVEKRDGSDTSSTGRESRIDPIAGILLIGVLLSVSLGNVPFWGNFNVLGTMADPTDGFVSEFGPLYHFDLLAPFSIFAAFGFVTGWRRLRASATAGRLEAATSRDAARAVALAALAASVLVVGAANAALVSTPVERHAPHTDRFEAAYEPFEEREFENDLVFLPTPYGQWQGHPFQSLRNDPGLDGEVVYALEGSAERDFAVLDAYPDRDYYRYTYRGEWTAEPSDPIVPAIQPLTVRDGASFAGETVVGVAEGVERVVVRLETDDAATQYEIDGSEDELAVDWSLEATGESDGVARLSDATTGRSNETGNGTTANEGTDADTANGTTADTADGTLAIDGAEDVSLSITLIQPQGATYTYTQTQSVRVTDGRVEVVWPPERTGCLLAPNCGTEGTYLPDRPELYSEWEHFETELTARGADSDGD
ncbi:glycosyltransferase family 39 protein [Haloterrigena salinisoli]|uniref:ArnT family glycosyltransferase n=1 Tax=Haloterrigena salinisoli TaxID=3132747 RepID=UPI0030CBC038